MNGPAADSPRARELHRSGRGCSGAVVLAAWALLALGCAPAALRPTAGPSPGGGDPRARPPNVLLLVTDDQRADALGSAGHPLLETPHLDRLAEDGVTFRNAFVTTSICAISRASIFTGRYARRHGVADFRTPLPPEVLAASVPPLLQARGYHTGCLGKWGIGGPPPREAFDVWDAWGNQGEYFLDLGGERLHNSEYLTRRAETFIREAPPDRPFFLAVLYKAPHDPYGQIDPRDARLFENDFVPLPRTATDAHFAALPDFVKRSEGRLRAQRLHPTPERYQDVVKDYLRLVASVDRSVGRLLEALRASGHDRDTVVIFTSDNGFFLGERGLSHKWLMYEESIRVPLLVRDPRATPGRRGARVDALALNIDLAPTILDLAGVPVPAEMDGRSLRPWLMGEAPGWRQDFFYEHHFDGDGQIPIPRVEGVRTERWKYVRYLDPTPMFEELFDLQADPFEEHNLAGQPRYGGQLASLRRRHQDYTEQLGRRPGPAARPAADR